MLLNALEIMLFLIQRGGAQAKPRVAFPFLYLERLRFFSSTAVMVRAVRTEMCVAWKVVGPAHDHDEEQHHHLQQQHLRPPSPRCCRPNAHSRRDLCRPLPSSVHPFIQIPCVSFVFNLSPNKNCSVVGTCQIFQTLLL
ncbi:unnamed protein product, partial [Sphagnum troendelagicum]